MFLSQPFCGPMTLCCPSTTGIETPSYRWKITYLAGSEVQDNDWSTFPPKAHLDWVFLMQHDGLPTHFLDWSKNALTALYFSVRSEREREAAVFVLDPRTLSEKCG